MQAAQVVYDNTVIFCDRFVSKFSRTKDQMVQAARSGVQNIAEGSVASATSKKIELKLTGIAKASLEELLLDYLDYLRQNALPLWHKEDPRALKVRQSYKQVRQDLSDKSDPYRLTKATPEQAANTLICLINQTTYLLGRQLKRLEQDFMTQGGFTERMYRVRNEVRKRY